MRSITPFEAFRIEKTADVLGGNAAQDRLYNRLATAYTTLSARATPPVALSPDAPNYANWLQQVQVANRMRDRVSRLITALGYELPDVNPPV